MKDPTTFPLALSQANAQLLARIAELARTGGQQWYELVQRLAKMNPLERLGTPEDIAAVVAFLVGADGGWINGQVLRANGGMV